MGNVAINFEKNFNSKSTTYLSPRSDPGHVGNERLYCMITITVVPKGTISACCWIIDDIGRCQGCASTITVERLCDRYSAI